MPDTPPSGLDRADGSSVFGTATPAAARQRRPGGFFIEEDPTSPSIERGEQATIVHTFKCDEATGLTLIQAIGRGYIQTDDSGNQTRVLSSLLTRIKGDNWQFTTTSESTSFDTPPDDFDVTIEQMNPAIEKHPHFADLLNFNVDANGNKDDETQFFGPEIITYVRNAANSASIFQGAEYEGMWDNSTNVGPPAIRELADELLIKLRKGEETFYVPGIRVTWGSYFRLPPRWDGGGYIQDPVTQGGLPSYFCRTTGDDSGDDIFTIWSAITNPEIYGGGISWLREADDIHWQRSWFKQTRTWIGAPLGHWDTPVPYPAALI